jgi:hypothetical protein
MNPELDTLATRLYVMIDDELIDHPEWAPERPKIGITPKLSDAERVTLAVIQAFLGFTSEARTPPPSNAAAPQKPPNDQTRPDDKHSSLTRATGGPASRPNSTMPASP